VVCRRSRIAAAGVGAVLFLALHAGAAAAAGNRTLEVRVLPKVAGIRLELDGRPFMTNEGGIARIGVVRGTHRLSAPATGRAPGGLKLRFSRWGDSIFTRLRPVTVGEGVTRLELGFEVSRSVTFRYVDLHGGRVDPEVVDEVLLVSSLGARTRFRGVDDVHELGVSRPVRRIEGLEETPVQYSVDSVRVRGSNVVHRAQQRFFPRDRGSALIQLLFYSAKFSSRDAFFGFPVGKTIEIEFPDGRSDVHPLTPDTQLALTLPRGDYVVTVEAPGLKSPQPVALSRDQVVAVKVLTYYDIATTLLVLGSLALGLLAVGRPGLVRRPLAFISRLLFKRPKGEPA